MRKLPITLWSCVITDDHLHLSRVVRVLRYCSTLIKFERIVLFSFLDPGEAWIDCYQIPKMDIDQFNIFVNRVAPSALLQTGSPHYMSVHEDGFILAPTLWENEFLEYDYIGAPWVDGAVGNGGFNIESRQLMAAKMVLPFYETLKEPFDGRMILPSDVYLCREHRAQLEGNGFTFAPTEIALRFSTEQTGKEHLSFGFHGRVCQPGKYAYGWKQIVQSEE